jgi:hypothetical protein
MARMTPPAYPGEPRARSRRALIVVAVLLLPVLVLFACYLGYRLKNSSAVSRLEKQARGRGEPLTLAELEAKLPQVADGENAAVALLDLWKSEEPEFWQAFLDGTRPLPKHQRTPVDPKVPMYGLKGEKVTRTKAMSAAGLAAGEAYLKSKAAHLQKVREALRRPQCRFPLNITEGFQALLPHLSVMKEEAQLFRLEAAVATERGEVDMAITALTNAARTGQLLAEEPFLISQLVRLADLSMALLGTEHLLSRRDLTAAQLGRLEAMFAQMSAADGLGRSYLGERATALSMFDKSARSLAQLAQTEDAGDALVSDAGERAGKGLMSALGLAGADKRLMLETFDEALRDVEKETPEVVARRVTLFEEATSKARGFPPKIYTGLLLPAMSKVGNRFATYEARRRAALTALAVERYRLANKGTLPQNLEALVPRFLPEVPLDPYDGQALRYRRAGKGYVIYSVGSDLADNDGLERPPNATPKQHYDDTFTVER